MTEIFLNEQSEKVMFESVQEMAPPLSSILVQFKSMNEEYVLTNSQLNFVFAMLQVVNERQIDEEDKLIEYENRLKSFSSGGIIMSSYLL